MIIPYNRIKKSKIILFLSIIFSIGFICKIFGIGFFVPIYYHYEEKYPETNSIKIEKTEIVLGNFNHGYIKNYFKNGNLTSKGFYKYNEKNDSLIKIYNWKFYHDTGELFSEGKFVQNKKEGYWKQYFKNNKIATEGHYKEGKETGIWKYYYDQNGKLKDIQNFKDGLLNGEKLEYYENGNLKQKSYFISNKKEGQSILFYKNGIIKSLSTFKNGNLFGKHIEKYENGQISVDCEWRNENPFGPVKIYNKDGKLTEEFIVDINGNISNHNKYE